jgi:hypothetical protein
MQHHYYGNTRTLQRRWPNLVRYQENLIVHAKANASHDGLAVCDTYQDWLCGDSHGKTSCCASMGTPGCPVGAEMAGFNYILGLAAMARMAAVLGQGSAAARYAHLASQATQEFHSAFYNSTSQRYGDDTGATLPLSLPALKIGSAPPSVYQHLVETVRDDLQAINYTMEVGAVTSKIIFNVLSESGLHEFALRQALSTENPSIGYWWKKFNATTCFETFPVTLAPQAQGSLNHIFLCGGVGHWMWKHLVGLTPAAPGFAQVSLRPRVHDSVGPRSVDGQFLSPKGMISSSWKIRDARTVELSVRLPTGVEGATIVVPKPTQEGQPSPTASITLGGKLIWAGSKLVGTHAGILGAKDGMEGVVFYTTNGVFDFVSTSAAQPTPQPPPPPPRNRGACLTCRGPVHSWSTLPVSFHSSAAATGPTGTFSDKDIEVIKRFPLVTIEKWQGMAARELSEPGETKPSGAPVFLWEEDAWLAAATQVKQASPNTSVVVWMDSTNVYTGWNWPSNESLGFNTSLNPDVKKGCTKGHFRPAEFLETHRSMYLLQNRSGQTAVESWSGCHIYDHSKPIVRDYWQEMCLNMTASGVIDGCGADFSSLAGPGPQGGSVSVANATAMVIKDMHVDSATAAAWVGGKRQMLRDTTAALRDGLLIAKHPFELGDYANGVLQEYQNTPVSNATIVMLQEMAARAKTLGRRLVYQCHVTAVNETTNLPAFLIGAGADHYLAIGGWSGASLASVGHWDPAFDKPLGEPLADGTYDSFSGLWTREFKSGTQAWFNAKTGTGRVSWASPR